jgi:hypothetical protein
MLGTAGDGRTALAADTAVMRWRDSLPPRVSGYLRRPSITLTVASW